MDAQLQKKTSEYIVSFYPNQYVIILFFLPQTLMFVDYFCLKSNVVSIWIFLPKYRILKDFTLLARVISELFISTDQIL